MPSPSTLPTRLDPPPITGNTIDQEFLSQMAGPNATPDQVEAIGRAWHVAQSDIDAVTKLPQASNPDEYLNREARTAIAAAMCEAAINQKGLVVTSAIQVATNEQLSAWSDNYQRLLHQNYRDQIDTMLTLAKLEAEANNADTVRKSTTWLELRNTLLELREAFDRQAGFLWEAQEMSGLNKVLAL